MDQSYPAGKSSRQSFARHPKMYRGQVDLGWCLVLATHIR